MKIEKTSDKTYDQIFNDEENYVILSKCRICGRKSKAIFPKSEFTYSEFENLLGRCLSGITYKCPYCEHCAVFDMCGHSPPDDEKDGE